jgi:threonine dehydrogenase-like Zn-dependent dehydrogenase
MQAIRYNATVSRYFLAKALGWAVPSVLWSGIACAYSEDVPEPTLPADDWVVVKTRYGGICGSDMSAIHGHATPYYEPLTSMPLTFGHENVGQLAELGPAVSGWQVGERVVVEPLLWCRPRGIDPQCSYCARGEINRCDNFTEGELAPGMYTGLCSQTGGSWSPYFLAHISQLYRVPDNVSDENGLLVEPFASALHAVLSNFPTDDQSVLIIGAGTIGLLTLAALRQLGSRAKIIVSARYPFQVEAANRLDADIVISDGDLYSQVASLNDARIFQPTLGKRVIRGGPDLTFECAGTDSAIDDAIRITRTGGKVTILGFPGIAKGIDWSALFAQELVVNGSFLYHHVESYQGSEQPAFSIALDLFSKESVDLGWLISHRFKLSEYKSAFRTVTTRKKRKAIKAVFDFGDSNIITP